MKSGFFILQTVLFASLWIIASCGADNVTKKADGSSSSGLENNVGNQCACEATYSPVCGVNNVTYDNLCIAKCHNITRTMQGKCECSDNTPVCGSDGRTWSECDAQERIRLGYMQSIVSFSACKK